MKHETCNVKLDYRGQVVLEYLVLFAAVAALTILGVATFDDTIRNTTQGFYHAAANEIAN